MTRNGEEEPNYLPRRHRPEAESGLIVLRLLDALPEATDAFLLKCCVEGELLSYFELMPALTRLTRDGQAVRYAEGTVWRYALTDAGRETLQLFCARIPASDREKINTLLPAWLEQLRLKREFTSRMRQTEDGEYEVSLSVMERGAPLLTLTAPVPSAELAARMTRRWEQAGPEIYREITALMEDGEA